MITAEKKKEYYRVLLEKKSEYEGVVFCGG